MALQPRRCRRHSHATRCRLAVPQVRRPKTLGVQPPGLVPPIVRRRLRAWRRTLLQQVAWQKGRAAARPLGAPGGPLAMARGPVAGYPNRPAALVRGRAQRAAAARGRPQSRPAWDRQAKPRRALRVPLARLQHRPGPTPPARLQPPDRHDVRGRAPRTSTRQRATLVPRPTPQARRVWVSSEA